MRRRRPRSATALMAAAVLLALLTGLALRGHLARLEARAGTPGPLVPAVVAAGDLPRGTVLSAGHVRVERRAAGALPPGALRSSKAAIGATLAADVALGEVLTDRRIARAGPVAALIPPGLRAVPVAVAAPPGSVAPGDRVDVLAVAGTRPFAEVVAREAEVLLVLAADAVEGLGSASTLMLLVDPGTAGALARAAATARLSIAIAAGPDA